jgi:uncharacterized protein (DUF1697 family)
MARYVALLRGVNLGKRSLSAAALRDACAAAGGTDVQTYVNSGNVVFTHAARSTAKLEAGLERVVREAAGFDVPTVVRTAKEMAAIVAGNPYPNAAGKELHVVFMKAKAPKTALAPLDRAATNGDEYTVAAGGRELYLHLPNGIGRSKLGMAVSKLSVDATARNWNTVTKLAELAAS